MSPNYVEEFPFEKLLPSMSDVRHIILFVGWKSIDALLWSLMPSVVSQSVSRDGGDKDRDVKQSLLRSGDADVVLRSLGLFSDGGGEAKSLEDLEEENPRLEEVKEAFDVFDENRDGFICAEELQKVLCALGFSEGFELDRCMRMIAVFDENGDGRIDFAEFVRLMESSSSCSD